jgi:hypothetical protein
MEQNRRFTLLTFPQFFDGATLTLRVVVLPRNQNPLLRAIEGKAPAIPDAPPFADAQLSFNAMILTGTGSFPNTAPDDRAPLPTANPIQARALFTALGNNFDIDTSNPSNADLTVNKDKADDARDVDKSVKKYLPLSYRNCFNFTTPRTPNAVTDDSYHCAVRGADKVSGFTRTPDTISWGKVFAYALRQPALAQQLGMIYETSFDVNAAHFPHGGWLYVDLTDDSDYKAQQLADENFIKRYAARIPALRLGAANSRQLFAPLLFPVLAPGKSPDDNYDDLFIEAAAYDDGFAKIVHANQPHSRNLLAEESDGAHPVKDVGIRLGWDDEQILIWYMRQMARDESVAAADGRIDAPLGVFGYAIDVRNTLDAADAWESLTHVASLRDLSVPKDKNPNADTLSLGPFEGELPFQVYPAQLDGDKTKNYWLPMYFANWNGRSMVLPDDDAARIYQTTNPKVKANSRTSVKAGGARNQLNDIYGSGAVETLLRYGQEYEFRVRLRDLSGGGPPLDPAINALNESPAGTAVAHFKRYVAPNRLRIEDQNFNNDVPPQNVNQLNIRRSLLNYPAAVYAQGLYADPVQSLVDAAEAMIEFTREKKGGESFGIADPDVDRVEITVEVQALKLDKLLSVSGTEDYVHLYTTQRSFPFVNDERDYDALLNIPVVYKDCPVLHTAEDERDVTRDFDLPRDIDDLEEIVLPTARVVRLTLRAVCENKARNSDYYGLLQRDNNPRHERDVRFGHITQMTVYQPSEDETGLFIETADAEKLRGIYLQPDPPFVFDGNFFTLLLGKEVERPPDMIQRLAKQLKLESTGLTLNAPKGERVQFGCSNRIRHTLAPDNSSITFASKGDLMNHWLCCLTLTVNRDWTWDALEDRSFTIKCTKLFTHDTARAETGEVGDIEIKHTASFESLHEPRRNYTRLIFIDAVEPKNTHLRPTPLGDVPRFPDTIEVTYTVEPQFKPDHGAQNDGSEEVEMGLPITTPPAQVPKVASAGIALSPYNRNKKYSATEPRQRFLWIEFAEPISDPDDTYFARVLAYAPDQLISNNHPEQFVAPEEPALPIDPEYIRVVAPGATNDLAGLNAMQPMQKATDSGKHYLLPLPPTLHADAPEMFGFFTYEFRVGHYRESDTEDKDYVWCTAQGRFGRPLRATGIQHPAPTLTCTVNRDEEKLYVSAPYAVAVHEGKNVTADPPRTQLWCLLYAQVKQADNRDFRNILLDDRQLDWQVRVEDDRRADWLFRYDERERETLKRMAYRNSKDELGYYQLSHLYKLVETDKSNKDATKHGVAVWSNDEVGQLLRLYGLPVDSSLSVLVVEVLPNITNIWQHISGLDQRGAQKGRGPTASAMKPLLDMSLSGMRLARPVETQGSEAARPSPLSDALGHHRILRTSPLTEVPYIC